LEFAARIDVEGQCCICGVVGKLSYEHVPPEAAYNDQRIFESNIQKMIADGEEGRKPKGKWVQRGAGRFTLCEKCNNLTGVWYSKSYVAWARLAKELLDRSDGQMSLEYYPYRIFPLRVIKQVVTMFCSACGPNFQKRFPDIPKFILNRDERYLPYGMKVYAYLLDPERSVGNRQSPMSGVSKGGTQHIFAEVAFAPLGFVLTGDVVPVSEKLVDITNFSYSSFFTCQTIFLNLPVLPINTWLPGDFRTKEDIAIDLEVNKQYGRVDLDVLR
jgi:hypothetical protein